MNRASSASSSVADMQREMRFSYLGGAPGMLVSASVWLIASLVNLNHSAPASVWALFIGGALIHPISVLLTRAVGRSGRHSKGNPMGTLAMGSTIWMIYCLPLVYAISLWRMDLFFPAMMMVIGGRFLVFATIYGAAVYRVCGAVLALAAYGIAASHLPAYAGGFAGSAIEGLFALIIYFRSRSEPAPSRS